MGLEKHGIQSWMESLKSALLQSKPDDPYAEIAHAAQAKSLSSAAVAQTRADEKEQLMIDVFNHYDWNGDGMIDLEELQGLLVALDPYAFDDGQCDLLLSEIDTNGDGRISYKEFVHWVMHGTKEAKTVLKATLSVLTHED